MSVAIRVVRERTKPQTKSSERGAKVLHWRGAADITGQGAKKFDEVKDASGAVIDYRNVKLSGYLSTFRETTESDRQGDYVEKGAFRETIASFMRNPVLLANHHNNVGALVGSFVKLEEDDRGLRFEAVLSNSGDDFTRGTRAKVAEGHLRTVSMGGRFHYKDDGRGIFKVDLYEGSLTPIPANPDAVFAVRTMTDEDYEAERRGQFSGAS